MDEKNTLREELEIVKISRFKKLRSIVAMLLVLVMMAGMLPTSAFAAGEEITGADDIGNEIIADDGMVEGGDGEYADRGKYW